MTVIKIRVNGSYQLLAGVLLALLLGQILALLPGQTIAAENGIHFREFSIHAAENPRVLQTNLKLDYELTNYLREGLLNGMTLENEIHFDLEWHSNWLWNSRQPFHTITSELKYHPLSKQYQVFRSDTQENWSYPNLLSALNHMGTLTDEPLPPLPQNAYNNDASIYVSAKLTPKTLYLPLKIQALFSDRYSLESEGVMWQIP